VQNNHLYRARDPVHELVPWVKNVKYALTATSAPQGGVHPERELSTILGQIFKRGNKDQDDHLLVKRISKTRQLRIDC
jgi:hypothetical protein